MSTDNTPNATPVVTTGHEESASSVSLQGQEFKSNDVGSASIAVDPTEAEIDADLAVQEAEDGAEPGNDAEDTTASGDDGAQTEPSEESAEDPADLPDYNVDDEAVIAKYDEKYLKHDEKGNAILDLDAFNAELNANYAEGKLDINEGSRQWVKDTFGVDDKAIDLYLQGLKTEADKIDNERYDQVGGKDAWDGLIEWGKANYTQEQQKRFNEAVHKGGEEAKEQIELLKARAGGTSQGKRPGLRNRRPSSPAKSAGGSSAPVSKVEPFATPEDHRVAMVEAEASNNLAKVEEVRKRLRASSWFKA